MESAYSAVSYTHLDVYKRQMFTSIEKAFDDINSALSANRDELKDMAYRTQMDADDAPEAAPEALEEQEQ